MNADLFTLLWLWSKQYQRKKKSFSCSKKKSNPYVPLKSHLYHKVQRPLAHKHTYYIYKTHTQSISYNCVNKRIWKGIRGGKERGTERQEENVKEKIEQLTHRIGEIYIERGGRSKDMYKRQLGWNPNLPLNCPTDPISCLLLVAPHSSLISHWFAYSEILKRERVKRGRIMC